LRIPAISSRAAVRPRDYFGGGQSCRSAAKTFMVSVASVARAVGSPAALQMGRHRPYFVVRERDWVPARIAEKPDLTVRALLKELANRAWWSATMLFGIFSNMKG
jgi:transposase